MTKLPNMPELSVGPASRRGAVTVLPLFAETPPRRADYRVGADAIAEGSLEICELEGGASVGRLDARNRGGLRALLVEGDHFLGAKQNRVLTSSALVGARGRVTLPVSCVESGRWHALSGRVDGAVAGVPAGLRRIVKQTVTHSLFSRGSRDADQNWVWGEIAEQQRRLRVSSVTSALSHTYAARSGDIGDVAARLPYVPGALGVAIGVGGEIMSIDFFDDPATCKAYWPRLVQGAALEGLSALRGPGSVGAGEVRALLDELGGADFLPVLPVGEGAELRTMTPSAASASVLLLGRCVVHFGAVTGVTRSVMSVSRIGGSGVVQFGESGRPEAMRYQLPEALAGRYTIAGRIGAGGAKEVFRATDARGGPDVAIARLPGVEAESFEREVALARRVESEFVPRLFESLVDGYGDGYLVMEHCDGPSLAQVVGAGALSVADAGPILLAFARGLRAIHEAAVLHRDVKLENAMLAPSPGGTRLKILDFGLSAQASCSTTAVGTMPLGGTLPYMAREVLRGGEVDARVDVYAFGVCCFRMLVGEFPLPPRDGESQFDYMTRVALVERLDLSRLPARLPGPARDAVCAMLAIERERRPFMPSVVAAFERAFEDHPIVAPSAIRAGDVPSRPLGLTRASRLLVRVASPEHLLVAACDRAPLVALDPDVSPGSTEVRAFAGDGTALWSRRVEGRFVAGLRADLDGDGVREIYLAGSGRVAALDASGGPLFSREIEERAGAPALVAVADVATTRLSVDGRMFDPRTGEDVGALAFAYEGDGRRLRRTAEGRGLAYNGFALQGFRGGNGTGAAIVSHPGSDRFFVAHLEEGGPGRRVRLVVYGPGGSRVHTMSVAECELATGDAAEIDRLIARGAPLFGPEHTPIAALGEGGKAVVVVPLLGADRSLPSCLCAFELPSGRELWRRRLDGVSGGRALFADVDGDGRAELVVGAGGVLVAYDAFTGRPSEPVACPGLPVAFGDPFATGRAHLITASIEGVELWRGPSCAPGTMQWSGQRADLWRSGALQASGLPFGPV